MILFVPIKYETYYLKQDNEVVERIIRSYDSLIRHLTREAFKSSYYVAITPVLTMGDLVFKEFNYSGNNPSEAVYQFITPNAKFSPKFCEQPLIYILCYIRQLIKYGKKSDSKERKIYLKLFGGITKDKQYMDEIEKLEKMLIKRTPFVILQDSFKE